MDDFLKKLEGCFAGFEMGVEVILRAGELVLLVSVFAIVSRKTDSLLLDVIFGTMFFVALAYMMTKVGTFIGWLFAVVFPRNNPRVRRWVGLILGVMSLVTMSLSWVLVTTVSRAIEQVIQSEAAK
ncbi:MAG TPA: hypothetical protein VIT45_17480 [Allosphingosinicella sp.]